jgi:cytochrome P450
MVAVDPGQGWNLYEIASRDDPHAAWRAIRERSPVLDAGEGVFFVTRWDLVDALLRDARHGAGVGVSASFGATDGLAAEVMRAWLMSIDGPAQSRARGLVRRAFTPRRIEALRPLVEQTAHALVGAIESRAGEAPAGEGAIVDLVAELAFPLPSEVIRTLFGIPEEAWRSEVLPHVLEPADGLAMIEGLACYFGAQVDQESLPQGLLAQLSVPDPELGALSRLEVVANAVLLVTAAIDTTAGLIGNAIHCLLDRTELLEQVRREPKRLDGVVEETLRFEPPALSCTRTAGCDLELEGVRIPAGSQLLMGLAAANRDPARYPEPDRFDPTRERAGLLSFGGGRHFCLGAALARLEARVALERLLSRSDLELERIEPPRWQTKSPTVRALERLPVRVTRRAARGGR